MLAADSILITLGAGLGFYDTEAESSTVFGIVISIAGAVGETALNEINLSDFDHMELCFDQARHWAVT